MAGAAAEEDSERLIGNALEALRSAKSSGRDCVARFGEFAAEAAAGPCCGAASSCFRIRLPATSSARAAWNCEPTTGLADAAALFRRTRLPAFPVVDEKGEVAGLLTDEAVRAAIASGVAANVADAMSADVTKFDEQTDFVTLLQYFAEHPEAVAIVVRDGKPTGLLTSDSLVTPVNATDTLPGRRGNPDCLGVRNGGRRGLTGFPDAPPRLPMILDICDV